MEDYWESRFEGLGEPIEMRQFFEVEMSVFHNDLTVRSSQQTASAKLPSHLLVFETANELWKVETPYQAPLRHAEYIRYGKTPAYHQL